MRFSLKAFHPKLVGTPCSTRSILTFLVSVKLPSNALLYFPSILKGMYRKSKLWKLCNLSERKNVHHCGDFLLMLSNDKNDNNVCLKITDKNTCRKIWVWSMIINVWRSNQVWLEFLMVNLQFYICKILMKLNMTNQKEKKTLNINTAETLGYIVNQDIFGVNLTWLLTTWRL